MTLFDINQRLMSISVILLLFFKYLVIMYSK